MALPEAQMPAGILPFAAADHVITPDALYVQVDRQAGHTRSRRRFRSVPTMVNTSVEMTQTQLEAFFDWHEQALVAGSLPFAANIAKIGPGTEWWKSYIVRYSVEHSEGSHHTVKVQLKLVDEPYPSGPSLTTMTVEFLGTLVASAGPNTGSDLYAEFFGLLETEVDLGPTLSAEIFGRLYTQVEGGPTNPSMDVEFLCALQTVAVLEPGAEFAAEIVCGLLTTTFIDTDLTAEFSAPLTASSSGVTGYVASPAAVFESAFQGFSPGGYAASGVMVQANGEIRQQQNNSGWALAGNWWSPTQPGVGTELWVKMTHLTGDPFNERVGITSELVGDWLSLYLDRYWSLVRHTSGYATLTAQVQIAADPDGTNIVSTFNVTLESEYAT